MLPHVAGNTSAACIASSDKPELQPHWFHSQGARWAPFSSGDSDKIEKWWQAHRTRIPSPAARTDAPKTPERGARQSWIPERLASSFMSPRGSKVSVLPPPAPPAREPVHVEHAIDPDESEETRMFKVPVFEDNLYDVDLRTMVVRRMLTALLIHQLYPALWAGIEQAVIRATWFYVFHDGTVQPIAYDSQLTSELDAAYDEAKPWNASVRLRTLSNSTKARKDGEKSGPSYNLPSVAGGCSITFDDAAVARVWMGNLSSSLYSYMWESVIVRGYDAACQVAGKAPQSKSGMLDFTWGRRSDAKSEKRGPQPKGEEQADAASEGAPSPSGIVPECSVPGGTPPPSDAAPEVALPPPDAAPESVVSESAPKDAAPTPSAAATEGTALESWPHDAEKSAADAKDKGGAGGAEASAAPDKEAAPVRAEASEATSWTALSEAFASKNWRSRLERLHRALGSENREIKDAESMAETKPEMLLGQGACARYTALMTEAEMLDEQETEQDHTMHIVFCTHGIGQKLSEVRRAPRRILTPGLLVTRLCTRYRPLAPTVRAAAADTGDETAPDERAYQVHSCALAAVAEL